MPIPTINVPISDDQVREALKARIDQVPGGALDALSAHVDSFITGGRKTAMAALTSADASVATEMGTDQEAFAAWRASVDEDAALVDALTSGERAAAESMYGRNNVKAIAASIRGIRRLEAAKAEHRRIWGD